jgi:hypothetical protein
MATDPTIIAAPAAGMDLTIAKTHSPNTVVAGQTFTYFSYRVERWELAVERHSDCDRDAAGGSDDYCALWRRLDLRVSHAHLYSQRRAPPAASYPDITVTVSCRCQCGAWHGDEYSRSSRAAATRTTRNNTATDPTIITSPTGGTDLTITKTQTGGVVMPGQQITFTSG